MTNALKKPGTAMSLADLDSKFNPNVIIPNKIKAALASLGDAAEIAEDFRKRAGVGTLQLSQYASEFEDFQVHIKNDGKPKTIWCGTKAFATKARERLLS